MTDPCKTARVPISSYLETHALLAVMEDDRDQAHALIMQMTDTEIARFNFQVRHLLALVIGAEQTRAAPLGAGAMARDLQTMKAMEEEAMRPGQTIIAVDPAPPDGDYNVEMVGRIGADRGEGDGIPIRTTERLKRKGRASLPRLRGVGE